MLRSRSLRARLATPFRRARSKRLLGKRMATPFRLRAYDWRSMAQLKIEIPPDLMPLLEDLAHAQRVSVEQVAVERLRTLVQPSGSPAAILRAMMRGPLLDPAAVDEMDAAIRAGRRFVEGASDLKAIE